MKKSVGLVILCFCLVFGTSQSFLDSSKLVDLSHDCDNHTAYWVGELPYSSNITTVRNDPNSGPWFQSDIISTTTHAGTHMDAPRHFYEQGWDISQIPLDRLVLPAVVVDISSEVGDDPNVHLRPEHLQQWEKTHGKIPRGSLLFVRTGWSKFWSNRIRYMGTDTDDESLLKFPSITWEAGQWILDNSEIYGLGIDTPSVDVPNNPFLVHQMILGSNRYNIENVNNLEKLPPKGSMVFAMPLKLKGLSASPVRVLALLPKRFN